MGASVKHRGPNIFLIITKKDSMTRVDILGVRIDQGTKEEVLSLVRDFLLSQQRHQPIGQYYF